MKDNNTKRVIVYSIDVDGANPNGDPDNMNEPRQDQNGYGTVSQYCIKHHTRNRLIDFGHEVFQCEPSKDDPCNSSLVAKVRKGCSDNGIDIKNAKKKDNETIHKIDSILMDKYVDIGLFGVTNSVISLPCGALNNVKGAVSVSEAVSIYPITIERNTLTHCITLKDNPEKGTSDSMGSYSVVRNATYTGYFSINPNRMMKNNVKEETIDDLEKAICTMFSNDESSARPDGSIRVRDVYEITIPNTVSLDVYDIKEKYREMIRNGSDIGTIGDCFPGTSVRKIK